MSLQSSATDPVLARARLFAALSGPFAPKTALHAGGPSGDPLALTMVATRLAEACDTSPSGAEGRWLMRAPERQFELSSLGPEGLEKAVSQRRQEDLDGETEDLLAVLLDEPPLARKDIEGLLTSSPSRDDVRRIMLALDRAGALAPSHDLLTAARSALANLEQGERRQLVVDRGFFGRKDEQRELAQWLTQAPHPRRVSCLFVSGAPGIGKSSLLNEALRRLEEAEPEPPLILRLDFDRAGLSVLDIVGLTMEAARQVAAQLGMAGAPLLAARLAAGEQLSGGAKERLAAQRQLPSALAATIGAAVAASGRSVLAVLDTLEVLRGRGESHPQTLFLWLDDLLKAGVRPIRVVAAGRGPALDSCRDRVAVEIGLQGLGELDAAEMLSALGTPLAHQPAVLAMANGNPLVLRLGAEIVRRGEADNLPAAKRDEELTAAFLYRFLLSRIDDPLLRRLAHPGLIVRRISPEVIGSVLAPALGLGVLSPPRASELFEALCTQHWLVERDPTTGFAQHRSDMRAVLLPLLYRDAPKQCAALDEAAMRWFAQGSEPWRQVEAAYHRLQRMRAGGPAPSLNPDLAAQFDDDTLDELPAKARDHVLATRGERTGSFRSPSERRDEAEFAREVLGVVQRQDWAEGDDLVAHIVEAGGLDVRSPAADAVRTLLWRAGRWKDARRWLSERDRLRPDDEDLPGLPDPVALARLEMRAEFPGEGARPGEAFWRDVERLRETAIAASDDAARQGALAMLALRDGRQRELLQSSERDVFAVSAADVLWGGAPPTPQGVRAMELGRARIEDALPAGARLDEVLPGRLLATLTPYSVFANNLAGLTSHRWLVEDAGRVCERLARVGALLSPAGRVPTPPARPISYLTQIGLFSEWIEAAGFLRRDPDLTQMGRAAERWRRTVAGRWDYGTLPRGWPNTLLDETLSRRLKDLLEEADPPAAALAHIGLWDGAQDDRDELAGLRVLGAVRRRSKRSLEAMAASWSQNRASPEELVSHLLQRRAPAAFAPGLAVLIIAGRI